MADYQKIRVGDRAEISHRITQQDLDKFVQITGDDNKMHVDADFARATSFKKPVVHGMLSASFISTVIGTRIPGDGALWYSQQLEFHQPVRVGDELTVVAEVTKKLDRLEAIELRTDVFNQFRQKVISGTAQVKVIGTTAETTDLPPATAPTALVVGASGGIGREAARLLASNGFQVGIHYHANVEAAHALREAILGDGGKAFVVQADLRRQSDIKALAAYVGARFEQLSVLVNAATLPVPKVRFDDLDWEQVAAHLDINVRATFMLTKAVVPLMRKQRYGKIVNIASQVVDQPVPDWVHYTTGKAALVGLSKALAIDLARDGIRVNLVSPGMTDTDLVADISRSVRLMTAARTPLQRLATPRDVAMAILYLAKPESDFLTGETIRVTGGQVMI